jgi:hypothetical protein
MYPEDRVLVGVINRRRDFELARREHWYRIPRDRAPRSIDAEYIAFYFSRSFKEQNGGIHYYAQRKGHELVRRRDLLPDESDHRRAEGLYYKIQLGEIQEKRPPILNPTARPIAFVFTTWDRFVNARTIADLYSKADWFVERVSHALRQIGITPDRRWQDEDPAQRVAELRIACQKGIVMATAGLAAVEGVLQLSPGDSDSDVNAATEAIRAAVEAMGGPVFVDIPPEG